MRAEAEAICLAADALDDQFHDAIDLLLSCDGRVVVTGMGKMSCIGRKAVATFCSTGTPAVFLHPSEAVHGDLGIVTDKDVLLVLSNSGETREVLELMPFMKRFGVKCLAVTRGRQNSLAKRCQVVLATEVRDEVDAVVEAPTKSTTVTLAVCDALAITLMQRRGFSKEQFAIFHPGGFLGSKLLLSVADLMHQGEAIPSISPRKTLQEAIEKISEKRLGVVFAVDRQSQLVGVLTDGDLRRMIQKTGGSSSNPLAETVDQWMNPAPIAIAPSSLAAEAMRLMEDHGISVLPVLDDTGSLCGVIHMHDLIRAGLA